MNVQNCDTQLLCVCMCMCMCLHLFIGMYVETNVDLASLVDGLVVVAHCVALTDL